VGSGKGPIGQLRRSRQAIAPDRFFPTSHFPPPTFRQGIDSVRTPCYSVFGGSTPSSLLSPRTVGGGSGALSCPKTPPFISPSRTPLGRPKRRPATGQNPPPGTHRSAQNLPRWMVGLLPTAPQRSSTSPCRLCAVLPASAPPRSFISLLSTLPLLILGVLGILAVHPSPCSHRAIRTRSATPREPPRTRWR
jgi:hypothetical protein